MNFLKGGGEQEASPKFDVSRMSAPGMVSTLSLLGNNMQVRDKSVKTLQYTARMIGGYYAHQLSQVHRSVLFDLWQTCSMGRKVFRLGKSINCLQALLGKLTRLHKMPETVREVAFCLELLEHIFLGVFLVYDNVLFLGRARLLPGYEPKRWESRTFGTWFLHDVAALVRKLLLLGANAADLSMIQATASEHSGREVEARQSALRASQRRLVWELIKSFCDVNVSGRLFANSEFPGKAMLQPHLHFLFSTSSSKERGRGASCDGPVGLFGAVSAILAVTDAVVEEVG